MQQTMLFYSDHCMYCQQIIQELDRFQVKNEILRVSIDYLQLKGQRPPPQIHSVPALLMLPSKNTLFGKHVFDYLFNLHTGRVHEIIKSKSKNSSQTVQSASGSGPMAPANDEVMPHSLGTHYSDMFVYLDDKDGFLDTGKSFNQSYAFAEIENNETAMLSDSPFAAYQEQSSNTTKKLLPGLDDIQARRREEEKMFLA